VTGMELPLILLLITLAFAAFAGLAAIDGSDSRTWDDPNWWPDEAPKPA
jgi:hypothetical protein